MRRVAVAMLHDDDLVSDAVQETFVKLWQRRWRLGWMKEPRGYCMKTLYNCCIDFLRQQQRSNVPETALEAAEVQLTETTQDSEEQYHRLEEAIATLTPHQQRLIEMKYVRQLNIHEMAQQTGLSETNITTSLSRAYKALREKMDKA